MASNKLKPCPFCGRKAALVQVTSNEWFVKCQYVYCRAEQGGLYKSKQSAVRAWNRRAEPERKIGWWTQQDHNKRHGDITTCVYYCPVCSECGHTGDFNMNYCPNCGAKMEVEQCDKSEVRLMNNFIDYIRRNEEQEARMEGEENGEIH